MAGIGWPLPRGGASDAYRLLDPARTTVITGAGISTDSGIPDYRSPGSPPRNPMTVQTFRSHERNRRHYWARAYVGWARHRVIQPNQGHRDLAVIDPAWTVTQNVDGLHAAAGSRRLIELHGALDRVVCLDCGTVFDRDWLQEELTRLNPGFLERLEISMTDVESNPDGDVELAQTAGFRIRDCAVCAGPLKPDVVYFGEAVPRERTAEAEAAIDATEAVLVLGSSLAVHSALKLVRRAVRAGKPLVIVTDGPTRADADADVRLVTRVGPFLAGWRRWLSQKGRTPVRMSVPARKVGA